MIKPGAYGEPWIRDDERCRIVDSDNMPIVKREQRVRLVACVNALDGLDPAALAGLVAAVEAMENEAFYFEDGDYSGMGVVDDVFENLKSALAALKGE